MTVTTHERPLVTFAVFAYNQERYIREAVEGAFSQTYEPLEIILSDDCSSDRTYQIMKEMAASYDGPHEVRAQQNKVNLGLADHINSIVKSAKGEIICWAAGDDISIPQRTDILTKPMIENPETVGVHSTVREMDVSSTLGEVRKHDEHVRNLSLDSIIHSGRGVVSQAHAFRKVVFEAFGPLEGHLTNEGPAMAFRECLLGNIIYIPVPTVFYRIGSGVSTYSGSDLHLRKTLEPIKYTQWRLTAIRQMLVDLRKHKPADYIKVRKKLSKREQYFTNLLNINTKHKPLRSLISNMFLVGFDRTSLRAFVRVVCPISVYAHFASVRE